MSRLQINVTSRSCRVTKFESHKVFSREDDDFVWPIPSGTRRLPSRWGYGINRVFLVEMSYRFHTGITSRSLINGSDLMGFALRAVIKIKFRPKLIPIQAATWQQQDHRQKEWQSRNTRHGVLLPRRHSQGGIGLGSAHSPNPFCFASASNLNRPASFEYRRYTQANPCATSS